VDCQQINNVKNCAVSVWKAYFSKSKNLKKQYQDVLKKAYWCSSCYC